ncbi:MAG: hypothetical protein MZW92_70035 [Comamonadaceae bacterium]|nr:hypothetical protein [Comamonadaceae bacterium]
MRSARCSASASRCRLRWGTRRRGGRGTRRRRWRLAGETLPLVDGRRRVAGSGAGLIAAARAAGRADFDSAARRAADDLGWLAGGAGRCRSPGGRAGGRAAGFAGPCWRPTIAAADDVLTGAGPTLATGALLTGFPLLTIDRRLSVLLDQPARLAGAAALAGAATLAARAAGLPADRAGECAPLLLVRPAAAARAAGAAPRRRRWPLARCSLLRHRWRRWPARRVRRGGAGAVRPALAGAGALAGRDRWRCC